ncbi:hypothetical protein GCM10009850_120430 [Nonomuraea monospora]|uniref:Transposase n=1 Tax=Nonomuraea monospora TaxID=568818 RepID=A0ABN3D4G4_9ACTN
MGGWRWTVDRTTRRVDRPVEEHRETTEQEWRDLQQHFELRRGSPAPAERPCGSPCKHGTSAALFCRSPPIKRLALGRSSSTCATAPLGARVHGWLGEVEGLRTSLEAAKTKRASLNRIPADGRAPGRPRHATDRRTCPTEPVNLIKAVELG